jgi:hypothetical protein
MKPRVELVYHAGCPNVGAARTALLLAFARAGGDAHWVEWDGDSPECPDHARGYGSPAILVDGKDVAGFRPGAAASCRLGIPTVDEIAAALAPPGAWRQTLLALPGAGALLLPAGVCPACWPAYAGLLASLGLGFLMQTAYLLPLALALSGVALAVLWWGARRGRHYGPLAVGVAGVAIAVVGKFAAGADALLYTGVGLLTVASIWNGRRR